jgi:hypothetical protein
MAIQRMMSSQLKVGAEETLRNAEDTVGTVVTSS